MLIKCSECGCQVSSNAQMCPHCGNPINIRQGASELADEGSSSHVINDANRDSNKHISSHGPSNGGTHGIWNDVKWCSIVMSLGVLAFVLVGQCSKAQRRQYAGTYYFDSQASRFNCPPVVIYENGQVVVDYETVGGYSSPTVVGQINVKSDGVFTIDPAEYGAEICSEMNIYKIIDNKEQLVGTAFGLKADRIVFDTKTNRIYTKTDYKNRDLTKAEYEKFRKVK